MKSFLDRLFNSNKILPIEDIFDTIYKSKISEKNQKRGLIKQQEFLDTLHLEHYEFDNIFKFNNKKTNHQELVFDITKPLNTISINKIYKGKFKIWYHKSVKDHVYLSETIPYEIIDVAVKIIEHSDAVDNENNEPEMLHSLSNENEIIKLFGYHIDPIKKKCIIVIEWCNGGDLFSFVENYALSSNILPVSISHIKFIVKWLINAILKCHNLNIIYSDLKLDNIMLANQNDINTLKLIDFGAAKYVYDNGKDIIYKFLSTSIHYTPPEVIHKFHMALTCDFLKNYELKGKNLFKIDIWQIGIITYVLVNNYFPFDSNKNNIEKDYHIFKQIEACPKLRFFKNKDINGNILCDDNCKDFINKLLAYNPLNRMSLIDALKHPWLN
jgi:serine/threonine protein kinase